MNNTITLFLMIWFLSTNIGAAQETHKELAGTTIATPPLEIIHTFEDSLSRNPNNVDVLVRLGRLYHDQAALGNEEAVDKSFTCLDKALELDPRNATALVFRGSLWTIKARDAWWPFTKISRANRGIDEIDKAAAIDSSNATVRMVRGIHSLHLPSFFGRLKIALDDFHYLLNLPDLNRWDSSSQSMIYYWSGIAFERDGQVEKAKELFHKAVDVAPNSPTAVLAEQKLNAK